MNSRHSLVLRVWVAALGASTVSGCGTVRDRNPVPEALSETATIPGVPYARFWGDGLPPNVQERLEAYRARVESAPGDGFSGSYLAISGRGANGAFGAGLLVGWSEAGNRLRG